MIARLITAATLIFCPLSTLNAACEGRDLRPLLSAAEQAELQAFHHSTPYPSGNHWLAEKDQHQISVIGTVHLGDARLGPVFDRLSPVLAAADRIYLEMTPQEQAQLQRALSERPELVFLTQGPTLIDLLDQEEWDQLSKAAQARNIPSFMAVKFQPWYLSVLLSVPPCVLSAMGEGRGLDHLIMGYAAKNGVPLQALEPYDTIFSLFSSEPIDTQIAMMRAGLLSDQDSADGLVTLLNSYFDQSHAASWYLAKLHAKRVSALSKREIEEAFDKLQATLLRQRNLAWMPHIIDTTSTDTIVVAVGAAHLHGSDGVLAQLKSAGYRLSRQEF